jgi:hypothetical protein
MSEPRKSYRLTLTPNPGTNAIRALRWILKYALRQQGMRCSAVEEVGVGDIAEKVRAEN